VGNVAVIGEKENLYIELVGKCVGNVAVIGKKLYVYMELVAKPEIKKQLGRPGPR
jgi:hypothetical protein